MPEDDKNYISEEEGIGQMKEAYDNFLRKIRKIEKESAEKIAAIIKKIEERKIEEIKKEINTQTHE